MTNKAHREIKLVTEKDIDLFLNGVGKDFLKNNPDDFTARLIATVLDYQAKEYERCLYAPEFDDYEGHLYED